MLSEFQTALVDSIKRCPHPLPQCVSHLKPKPKPCSPATNKPKVRLFLFSNIRLGSQKCFYQAEYLSQAWLRFSVSMDLNIHSAAKILAIQV